MGFVRGSRELRSIAVNVSGIVFCRAGRFLTSNGPGRCNPLRARLASCFDLNPNSVLSTRTELSITSGSHGMSRVRMPDTDGLPCINSKHTSRRTRTASYLFSGVPRESRNHV